MLCHFAAELPSVLQEKEWIQLESLHVHTQKPYYPTWTHIPANSTQQAGPVRHAFSVLMGTGSFSHSKLLVSVVYSSSSEMLPYWLSPMQTSQYQPSVPLLRGRKMSILQSSRWISYCIGPDLMCVWTNWEPNRYSDHLLYCLPPSFLLGRSSKIYSQVHYVFNFQKFLTTHLFSEQFYCYARLFWNKWY